MSNGWGCVIIALFLASCWLWNEYGVPHLVTVCIVVALWGLWYWLQNQAHWANTRAITISNVDAMEGDQFEAYLKVLLESRGYSVELTPASGDLGVDLVATGNGQRIAIQAKRHEGGVSRRAVSDAVAGMQPYACSQCMVITNSFFTAGAEKLARANGCILIDRGLLGAWISEFHRGSSDTLAHGPRKARPLARLEASPNAGFYRWCVAILAGAIVLGVVAVRYANETYR